MTAPLSILGVGVFLPPARPVRELVEEAGGQFSEYANWANVGVAGEDDHPSTMGARALNKALAHADVRAGDLNFIISAGMSRDYVPSWSLAAEWIRLARASADCVPLDITSGCLGTLLGLDFMQAKLADRGGGYAAIVAAERMSYTIDRSDSESSRMWGYADGAGAIVVSLNRPGRPRAAFHGSEYVNKSELNGAVLIKYGGTRHPNTPPDVNPSKRLLAPPPGVDLRVAYSEGYSGALKAMQTRFGVHPKQVICNQISVKTVEMIGQVAGAAAEDVMVTGHDTGHVGSVDMIVGLDRYLARGDVAEPVALAGSTPYLFGAGLITAP